MHEGSDVGIRHSEGFLNGAAHKAHMVFFYNIGNGGVDVHGEFTLVEQVGDGVVPAGLEVA